MIDLVDALCSQTRATSVVELSREGCFRRSYSAIFHAMREYRHREDDLAKLAGLYLPPWLGYRMSAPIDLLQKS